MTDICPICKERFNPYRGHSNNRKPTCSNRSCSGTYSHMKKYDDHADKELMDQLHSSCINGDSIDVLIGI